MFVLLIIYMVILTALSGITLLKYIFNDFKDGKMFLKLIVILCNIGVLGYMYSGVQAGVTIFGLKYEIFDNKNAVLENLYSITYYAAVISTILFIMGRLLIIYIRKKEDKEYRNRKITNKNKSWDNFYNKNEQ